MSIPTFFYSNCSEGMDANTTGKCKWHCYLERDLLLGFPRCTDLQLIWPYLIYIIPVTIVLASFLTNKMGEKRHLEYPFFLFDYHLLAERYVSSMVI